MSACICYHSSEPSFSPGLLTPCPPATVSKNNFNSLRRGLVNVVVVFWGKFVNIDEEVCGGMMAT